MLRIEKLTKVFAPGARPILNNIELELKACDFCVVIGANGSGKSTLFKTITGEVPLDSGNIFLKDKAIHELPIHQRARYVSSVAQDITKGTVQDMTLLENLSISAARMQGSSLKNFKSKTEYLVEKLAQLGYGLEAHLNTPMHALSGGQRQMIATIMATLSNPELLLLDEHCSALDPKAQVQVMEFTNRVILHNQLTALMITHHIKDALKYGNRLIMLREGKVFFDLRDEEKQKLNSNDLIDLFHTQEQIQ